ncbi:unnamed protein product [Adineta steineri]|uniref:protein-serine/threonine phosphatase n=1 Tax=Adineta steineri TaxID=433720 RepID=A0A814A7S5_9BILA|nr:unnamed protein product [Adineta steineri]CAF1148882.1 unnamed protein product [Adineta steineri]CAF1150641.1 unnamed protein product [Adineta steineri]
MLGITEVIDNLYISGLESRQAILNKGIRCVFNISSECPIQDLGPSVEYEKVSIQDLPTTSIQPYFDRITDRIHQNIQQGKKTLVHCYVGRSRSASIILAYLMKYQQMSLREAFYYLRSRRHIIGPNFGFIKQLISYERSLTGYTTVSFVNTSFGAVPDIYLTTSASSSRPRRPMPSTTTVPVQTTTTNNTISRSRSSTKPALSFSPVRSTFSYSSSPSLVVPPRQGSYVNRTATSALPGRSIAEPNNSNIYTHGASSNSTNYRPVTTSSSIYQTPSSYNHLNSSTIRQQPDLSRMYSASRKPFELTREYSIPPKTNDTFRTVKYVPSAYNRYHLP